MRRKTAKEVLAESFREIAESKNIDKITVKDITENCGYSSATFYRQFRDKYDLIAWDYTRDVESILSGVDGRKEEWQRTLLGAARFFNERKAYLANLLLHTSGFESFVTYMQEINYKSLKSIMEKVPSGVPIDRVTEMLVRAYVLGTVQFTCGWILGQYEATPEELATVYELALPMTLQKYFSE